MNQNDMATSIFQALEASTKEDVPSDSTGWWPDVAPVAGANVFYIRDNEGRVFKVTVERV